MSSHYQEVYIQSNGRLTKIEGARVDDIFENYESGAIGGINFSLCAPLSYDGDLSTMDVDEITIYSDESHLTGHRFGGVSINLAGASGKSKGNNSPSGSVTYQVDCSIWQTMKRISTEWYLLEGAPNVTVEAKYHYDTGTVVMLESGRYGFISDGKLVMFDDSDHNEEDPITAVVSTPEQMAIEFGDMLNGDKTVVTCPHCGIKSQCVYCGTAVVCSSIDTVSHHSQWCNRCNNAGIYKYISHPQFATILQIYLDSGQSADAIYRDIKKSMELERQNSYLTAVIQDLNAVFGELPPCPAHGSGCIPHIIRVIREMQDNVRDVDIVNDNPINEKMVKVNRVYYTTANELGGGDIDYLVLLLTNGQEIAIPNDADGYVTTTIPERPFSQVLQEAEILGRHKMGNQGGEFLQGVNILGD